MSVKGLVSFTLPCSFELLESASVGMMFHMIYLSTIIKPATHVTETGTAVGPTVLAKLLYAILHGRYGVCRQMFSNDLIMIGTSRCLSSFVIGWNSTVSSFHKIFPIF